MIRRVESHCKLRRGQATLPDFELIELSDASELELRTTLLSDLCHPCLSVADY